MSEHGKESASKSWPKVCFVIGPMKTAEDIARQRRLAIEILQPLLAPEGFVIETPLLAEQKQIMNQVIASLDRADLVVADITGGNPSVMYELGIRHCIGLPTITVHHKPSKSRSDEKAAERVAFDVSHYRYADLDLDDAAAGREVLQPTIEAALDDLRNPGPKGKYDNPVTEYYKGWPMIEGSPAAGLALGYYVNLVKRTADALRAAEAKVFLLDEKKHQIGELPVEQIERLDIYVPSDLRFATASYADAFRQKMKAQNCEIIAPGRRVGTFYVEANRALLDIPTTLSAIREAVKHRVPDDPGLNSDGARFVVSREINRFKSALKRLTEDELEPFELVDFLNRHVFVHELPAD
jgi:hypothetical protein